MAMKKQKKKLNIKKDKKHKRPAPAEKRKSGVGVLAMEDQKRKEDEYYENLFQRYEKRSAELKQLQADSLRKAADKKQAVARMLVRGFVFIPSDEVLVEIYLKEKNLGEHIDLCPIEEVDVYGMHPETLTEKYNSIGGVWHFFTQSRPNENENENENSGKWEFGEKKDVFRDGVKVGARQELEYNSCNGGGKYKMIEYQREPPAPATETNSEVLLPGKVL